MSISTRAGRIGAAALFAMTLATTASAVAPTAAGAAKQPPKLDILVSNDDGVGAEGIAVLVDALRKLPNVKITVVAPAQNSSGSGGKTTEGTLTATPSQTATGYTATAVAGFPADSVNYALDTVLKKNPNVVVSGINEGQNLGTLTDISGTVGAARAAAQRGIPALAVSADLKTPDYETAAKYAVAWIKEHRAQLAKKPKQPILLESMNVPTCPAGKVRGEVETVVAATAENALAVSDCASAVTKPTDDINAFVNGYVSLTQPPLKPAA